MSGSLKKFGRQSVVSIAGSVISAIASFVLVLVVTNYLGKEQAGVVLLAVAFFNIVTRIGLMGTATGLVRSISAARATNTSGDIPQLLRWALLPVAVVGTIVAGLTIAFADPIATFFTNGESPDEFAAALRAIAIVIPPAGLMYAALGATRGFSTMRPTVMIDRIWRPVMQLIGAGVLVVIGASTTWWAVAWIAPFAVAAVLALASLRQQLDARPLMGNDPEVTRESFWGFTIPQWGVDFIRVLVRWQDTLLIGILLGPGPAAIYASVTRLVKLASVVNQSLVEAATPQISEALAADDLDQAGLLYQASTAWLVVGVFPVYLVTALYSGPLSEIFGADFRAGATALVILSIGRILGTATGPVEAVLTMSGRSGTNFGNHLTSLIINVVLTLVLVPWLGLPGAALAWVASILVTNYGPYFQVRKATGLHPFGKATIHSIAVVTLSFALPAAIVHAVTDPGLVVAIAASIFSGLLVLGWAAKNQKLLALDQLLRRRTPKPAVDASQNA